jgi:hypothetical protein
MDKGLVNLENIDGKLPQIAQTGETGAEVIHCQAYPPSP